MIVNNFNKQNFIVTFCLRSLSTHIILYKKTIATLYSSYYNIVSRSVENTFCKEVADNKFFRILHFKK